MVFVSCQILYFYHPTLQPTADFQREAKDHGIEVIATESFSKDPSVQIDNLKVVYVFYMQIVSLAIYGIG